MFMHSTDYFHCPSKRHHLVRALRHKKAEVGQEGGSIEDGNIGDERDSIMNMMVNDAACKVE